MNVLVRVAVGTVDVTIDATDVIPDGLDEMTTKAVVIVRSLLSDEDLHAAAREPITVLDDTDDD